MMSQVEELRGEPFIFALCGEIEAWLQENNIPSNASLFDRKKFEQAKIKQQEEDEKILRAHVVGVDAHSIQDYDKSHSVDGTAVNDETFAEWNAKFMKDFYEERARNSKNDHPEWLTPPTGKKLFETQAREKLGLGTAEAPQSNLMVFDDSVFEDEELPDFEEEIETAI